MLRSEAIAPAPLIECLGVVIVAYSPSRGAQVARKASVAWRCTRCVALHPLWGAAPEQKGCNADGSGVLLLVLCLLWWRVALRCGHCSRWSAVWRLALDCALSRWSAVWPCACCGSLYLLWGAEPVAGRCTRYVALHPLWGAAPEQKGCNADGSGVLLLVLCLLWWRVALRCGHCSRWSAVWRLALDCALSRWSAVWPCACCGAAPVVGRCTRYVALHLLWGAAPEQKGCNADGSGVAQSRTRKGAVSVGESVSNCDEDRNAMRGFHSPSLVLSVIHSG